VSDHPVLIEQELAVVLVDVSCHAVAMNKQLRCVPLCKLVHRVHFWSVDICLLKEPHVGNGIQASLVDIPELIQLGSQFFVRLLLWLLDTVSELAVDSELFFTKLIGQVLHLSQLLFLLFLVLIIKCHVDNQGHLSFVHVFEAHALFDHLAFDYFIFLLLCLIFEFLLLPFY
jgi:hypothetical protein